MGPPLVTLICEGGVTADIAVIQDGRAAARIHGIVIISPRRFVDPVPSVNPALVRVAESAAAAE